MIAAIPPIPSIGSAESVGAAQATASTGATAGSVDPTSSGSFENVLGQAIDSLNSVTNNATNVSLEAASGTATVADAPVPTTEADLATQLASAVTSKAVDAFNTIMNMQF
jgi:flagellar hook-basal body complex protein FliE